MNMIMTTITPTEKAELTRAKQVLENPGFLIKAASLIGKPIEFVIEEIDSKKLNAIVSKALHKSLDLAINTMDTKKKVSSSNLKHKVLVSISGGVGGFLGLLTLALELPVSTTIMLRSIADIAQSQGHNIEDIETKLSCLEVFSLGSTKSTSDDEAESVYFASRVGLAYEMKVAMESVQGMSVKAIQDALAKNNMPMLIKLINAIASRFSITVSEKVAAQAVPIIGGVGGASINLIFMKHFQEMAEGHFIVKKLEKKYGEEAIYQLYSTL